MVHLVDGTKMIRALHYLRIGWTVLFGMLCMLLIGLWVGSQWQFQLLLFRMNPSNDLRLVLSKGQCAFCVSGPSTGRFGRGDFRIGPHCYLRANTTVKWVHYSVDSGIGKNIEQNFNAKDDSRFDLLDGSVDGRIIVIPPWLLSTLPCLVAVIPWLPWPTRFSLRTLLIAMAAVAVGLWLILWMAKR